MRTPKSDLCAIIRAVPYFAGLADERVRELAGFLRERSFRPGELILMEGEPCEGLGVVIRGRIKVFKRSLDGREQVLRLLGPGRTFNDVPVFDGGPNPGSVAALDACTVGLLPKARIQALIAQDPEVAGAVIRLLAGRLRGLTLLIEDLSLRGVTGRVAKALLDCAQGSPSLVEGAADSCVRLTQSQLASMTGSVREVVQRALKTLERDGAIVLERARIRVADPATLKRWAEAAPSARGAVDAGDRARLNGRSGSRDRRPT